MPGGWVAGVQRAPLWVRCGRRGGDKVILAKPASISHALLGTRGHLPERGHLVQRHAAHEGHGFAVGNNHQAICRRENGRGNCQQLQGSRRVAC